MLDFLNNYFDLLAHPFKNHKKYRLYRQRGIGLVGESDEDFAHGPDFLSMMVASWPFAVAEAIYAITSIHFGLWILSHFNQDFGIAKILIPEGSYAAQRINIIIIIANVVFFPLIAFLYTRLWSWVISFFVFLFDRQDSDATGIDQVVNGSLSSNTFLLIPIFGPVIKKFAMLVHLFAGLKNNIGLSNLQSIVVLLSPLLIMFVFAMIALMFVGFVLVQFLSIF